MAGKSRSAAPSPKARQPQRRRGGIGWLLLLLVVGGALAVFVFAPDIPSQIFGGRTAPRDLGPEPHAEPAERDRAPDEILARRGAGVSDPVDSSADDPARLAAPQVPVAPPEAPQRPDESLAVLARAEKAYQDLKWSEARELATRARGQAVTPAAQARADDLARRIVALEGVFTRLDSRQELQRGVDTHPSLVSITFRGRDQDILPLQTMGDANSVPNTPNPVAWVQDRIARGQKVAYLDANGTGGELDPQMIGSVRPADLASRQREREQQFKDRLARLQDGDLSGDALLWYEAGKFAYRNRLDSYVTTMMDQALALDPYLATTIREDSAREIFLKMVQSMEQGRSAGASGWMSQLTSNFRDTSVYPEAQAYFQGNVTAMREARGEAERQRREQRERARAEAEAQAKAKEDTETLARLRRQREAEEPAPAAPAAPTGPGEETPPAAPAATGDRAKADEIYAKGLEILARAQAMPAVPERDRLYLEGQNIFTQARDIYYKLGMEAEGSQANQYRYACLKMRRSFH